MNKAQCSTFTAAGASGLASVRVCFHLPDFNKTGRNWQTLSGEKHVCLCCAPTHPGITCPEKCQETQKVQEKTPSTVAVAHPRAADLPGALSYTHMTDTSVDKKLHMAFTPLVTAPAPWKGPAVLRVLAEACRALCCLGGCTLVSIDPRDSPPPSMP